MTNLKKHEQPDIELIKAAMHGKADDVLHWMPLCDQNTNTKALCFAVQMGHTQCVKHLIALADPKTDDSHALQVAAFHGHTECVKLLIPVSDPMSGKSLALRWAAQRGHAECVKLLIPISDAKADKSGALDRAVNARHETCVALLLPVSDYHVVLENLQKEQLHGFVGFLQQCIAQYEKTLIGDQISFSTHARSNKKI